jgi:hypothetical protein
MPTPELVELIRPASQQHLGFIKSRLDAAAIPYHVQNEYAAIGGIAAYNENVVVVFVPAAHAAQAQAHVEDLRD